MAGVSTLSPFSSVGWVTRRPSGLKNCAIYPQNFIFDINSRTKSRGQLANPGYL